MSKQLDLFDVIKNVDNKTCEYCGHPSKSSVHPDCVDLWFDHVVMKQFKNKEDENERHKAKPRIC